jgi:hypothetical protein
MRLIFIIILVFLANESLPQVIIVDQTGGGDYLTIQQGIDASQNGDTVLVYPGIYYENINFNGKNIVLCSRYIYDQDEWYICHTIIDGNRQGSVVLIISGEDETTTLCGFTIQNGSGSNIYAYSLNGGGIAIKDSKANIKDCIIKNNTANSCGGGIYGMNSSLFLSGDIIFNNYAIQRGGGIMIWQNSTIEFDTVKLNSIYLNHAELGCDFHKVSTCPVYKIVVDTFTVMNPDHFYVSSVDSRGYQLHDIVINIQHCKIETVDTNLYVNPDGSNSNSGLSPDDPLQSLSYAMSKIVSDSLHPNTIHLADGTYSPSLTGEKFPLGFRSYITIEGESMENTILDGENEIYHFYGGRLERNITFRNLTFYRGYGFVFGEPGPGGMKIGCLYSIEDANLLFDNVIIKECAGGDGCGLYLQFSDCLKGENIKFIDNVGSPNLSDFGPPATTREHLYENLYFQGCTGDTNIYAGYGVEIIIGGSQNQPNQPRCIFKNLVIADNHDTYPAPANDPSAFCIGLTDCPWVTLINATVGNNTCLQNMGSLALSYSSRLDIYNSIIYNPALPYELIVYNPPPYDPCFMNVYNTLFRGKDDLFSIYGNFVMYWGDEILDEDPLWQGEGDYPYALSNYSPCINTGTPMYVTGMEPPYIIQQDSSYYLVTPDLDTIILPATDMAGHARIREGRIDMGAYEYPDTGVFIPVIKPLPETFALRVYPNPFSDKTTVSFTSGRSCHAVVEIFSVKGSKTATLMDSHIPPGKFDINWDGTADNSDKVKQGAYICRLVVDGKESSEVKVVKGE